jgi:hypothetical protein
MGCLAHPTCAALDRTANMEERMETEMTTDIDFTVIPKLQEGERIIFHVEVGNLPAHKAMEYLESVRNAFKEKVALEDGSHYFFAPMRDGQRTVDAEIVKVDKE